MMKIKSKILGIVSLSIFILAASYIQTLSVPKQAAQNLKTAYTSDNINNDNSEDNELIFSRATWTPAPAHDAAPSASTEKTAKATASITVSHPPVAKKNAVKKNTSHQTVSSGSTKNNNTYSTAATAAASKAKSEIDLFDRLVNAEAGGESFEGKLAVATVIMNRLNNPYYPKTIPGVILDQSWGCQFTPVADGRINLPASSDSIKAVQMVINGYRSFGSNILYFVNPATATNTYVTKNKTYYTTIGGHEFFY